jgi:hypothetical protein
VLCGGPVSPYALLTPSSAAVIGGGGLVS